MSNSIHVLKEANYIGQAIAEILMSQTIQGIINLYVLCLSFAWWRTKLQLCQPSFYFSFLLLQEFHKCERVGMTLTEMTVDDAMVALTHIGCSVLYSVAVPHSSRKQCSLWIDVRIVHICLRHSLLLTPGAKKEARPKVSRQFETTDIFARNRHNISSFY
jgi:hypothetical protein